MAALWRADADLAARLDAIDDEDRFAVQPTRSGAPTVAVPAGLQGRMIYLHSRYDPLAEAAKLAEAVPVEDKFCFVVFGFGLGHHVKALAARLKGDAFIAVVEPSIRLLATALAAVDFSELLAAGQLLFLVDADKANVHARLTVYSARMMMGSQFVMHPPSQHCAPEFHATLRQLITDYVAYTRMSVVTLVANSQITCRNIAMNLPTYVATPPIDVLVNRFAGYPAIIVSAGPSLRRNIELLREAQGKAVICAVQTTFRPLMQRGIVPDFVTSLDYHEISRHFFEGIDDFAGVHLVAEPKASWHVIDAYHGPISLLDNTFARQLIGDGLAGRAGLKAGATVAHLAFYLAHYMGCDPIVFIGQDLAYTGYVYYVPGVEMHQTWRGEINRFNSIETREWERIVRNRSILRRVGDQRGDPVYTDDLLFTYLEQFEKDFQGLPISIINATEGGARIRGAQELPLRAVIDRYCTRPIDPECFAYRNERPSENRKSGGRDPAKLQPAREELAKRLEEIERLAALCDELLKLLEELKDLTHDPNRFNRKLVRVDELRTLVPQNQRAYQIINAACQLAELRRFTADRKLELVDASEAERAQNQIARDLQYIGGIRGGARHMTEILKDALARFDAAIQDSEKQRTR
ncbi:MAG TPA: 6-hydroxymethylpterin diphosphokinase MptE-like protein [Phycisphaerae bacterium]